MFLCFFSVIACKRFEESGLNWYRCELSAPLMCDFVDKERARAEALDITTGKSPQKEWTIVVEGHQWRSDSSSTNGGPSNVGTPQAEVGQKTFPTSWTT